MTSNAKALHDHASAELDAWLKHESSAYQRGLMLSDPETVAAEIGTNTAREFRDFARALSQPNTSRAARNNARDAWSRLRNALDT